MNHKKIAQLANVSASTVSKALSGSSEVNRATAEKIRRIAIDAGYFKEKSKRKREYANDDSFLIAVIVPEIMGFHYATIVTCIKNHVESKGGHIAIYISDFDHQKGTELLESIILHGGTDGVIMFSKPTLSFKPNIPIVCCCNAVDCGCDTIYCDSRAVIEDAVGYLSELGHTKIGYVGEPHTATAAMYFEDAVKQNGLVYEKEYTYIIYNSRVRDPFYVNRAWFYPKHLDEKIMQEAAQQFVGTHDFAAVRSVGTDVKSTVRTVYYYDVEREGDLIRLKVCANGFLYNMARAMAGTVVYAAEGKIRPEQIGAILDSGNRTAAGPTVPPGGLYMTHLWYDDGVEKFECESL